MKEKENKTELKIFWGMLLVLGYAFTKLFLGDIEKFIYREKLGKSIPQNEKHTPKLY